MIVAKRKRRGGHWIMRDGKIIGEAWKFKKTSGFGMSIGGPFTTLPPVYWRGEQPSSWGFVVLPAPRLLDLVTIAEKHFGENK